VRLFQRLKP